MASPPKRVITQDRLRSAVQNLLLETDWSEITVQHVSGCAGVSIGTFYNYYDSKDDALADVRQSLSLLIKKDLNSLLSTQTTVEARISMLLKYFINVLNTKPTWANYFYKADHFSERLEGGLVSILEPLVLESVLSQKGHVTDARMTALFIENGFFPLLKSCHHQHLSISDEQATQIVIVALSSLGLSGDTLFKAASMLCPVTPLAALPQSIYELENSQTGYV
ncbi:TetR/AcrR family transcriptional regulator [Marinomonas ostreistagni]|uniref:TetR/AcrR family transcriptional regulator n=1 Tax=Marinomonas ostreistagni TaxID=359209 RepID=A0ABS0Z7K2_9GAMM|nr:TetR/AcrR family transcriptional regulator [Marinomonas ostreistagni]MBJ7549408.1 TetR/AcrR family transcriptional regulator [Marinomonas ostreistagni]